MKNKTGHHLTAFLPSLCKNLAKPPTQTSPDVMTPKQITKARYNTGVLTDARADPQVIHHQGFCIRNFYTDVPFFSSPAYLPLRKYDLSFFCSHRSRSAICDSVFRIVFLLVFSKRGILCLSQNSLLSLKSCFLDISQLRGWLVVDVLIQYRK